MALPFYLIQDESNDLGPFLSVQYFNHKSIVLGWSRSKGFIKESNLRLTLFL
jgi:hypothetical protein